MRRKVIIVFSNVLNTLGAVCYTSDLSLLSHNLISPRGSNTITDRAIAKLCNAF